MKKIIAITMLLFIGITLLTGCSSTTTTQSVETEPKMTDAVETVEEIVTETVADDDPTTPPAFPGN